ncbi:MAG: hypothetical protein IH624_03040 [Phycisphaerae bacterium]|nr:hypothetical protein [Phycisphaerae bacterium]
MENRQTSRCSCCVTRRRFLANCTTCAVGLTLAAAPRARAAEGKTRIRVIYALHAEKQPGPDWPNVGFDFGPHMKRINAELAKRCSGFEFISSTATGPEQAKAIVEADAGTTIDGYIVYQMNCWNQVVQTVAQTGRPVLYADFQYGGSGGFLVYNAAFLRTAAPNVGFVASSRMSDLVAAVKCFQTAKAADFAAATKAARMKTTRKPGDPTCTADNLKTISPEECVKKLAASKILAVHSQDAGPAAPIMGIPMENVAFAEVNAAWESADKDQSRAIADRWQKGAAEVLDVSRETLETSAAMYLGMKKVLKDHNANAITINCLGGFYGGHIHAYPCLGFHELCNEGLVGACECDVRSTATMLMMNHLTGGRPGFISDPVIDTAKRQIIYAHCVAPNKMFGPAGATNPFKIMTHSEDRQGASVRSILPLDYMTTTMDIRPDQKEIIFHMGKAVENDPDDRACRTKLAAEPVGDIEKLFTEWDHWGWHRVTCYGDLKEPVQALAEKMNWKIIEEA